MEPVRFADVLFVFLTLSITFAILWLVNKGSSKPSPTKENSSAEAADIPTVDKE